MKPLLLALLLFSSPVFADEHTVYTTERPPSSWSGVIDMDADDYLEVYGPGEGGGQPSYFKGGTSNQASCFGAYKIIE